MSFKVINRLSDEKNGKERDMNEFSDFYKKILDHINDAVQAIDNKFNIIYYNEKASRISGIPPEEAIGKKCYDILPGKACNTGNCTALRVKKEGTFRTEAQKHIIKRDKWIPVEIRASPIFDNNGHHTATIEVISDISERNSLLESLAAAAISVSSTAEELAASSQEMNSAFEYITKRMQNISEGATRQTEQVETSSSKMKLLSDMIENINENASNTSKKAEMVEVAAKKGSENVKVAQEKMNVIKEFSIDSAQKVKTLEKRSLEINKIVDTISGIAKQTNLLALNAAIEAARAGEHGKGFAVVAEEVRKLAEDSAKAADRISELIDVILGEVENVVESMEKGTKEVISGAVIVGESLITMEDIIEKVGDITSSFVEISNATGEQNSISQEVLVSIKKITIRVREAEINAGEVSSSVQEVSASMEELTSSANEMAQLAVELREKIGSSNYQLTKSQ